MVSTRTIAAFAVAPIAPPVLCWAFGPSPTLATLPAILLYGSAWTYALTIIIGGLAYRLITKHSQLRALHIFAISLVIGTLTWFIMGRGENVGDLATGGLLGLSAGAVFWLVWRRSAAEPRVAADRAAPGR